MDKLFKCWVTLNLWILQLYINHILQKGLKGMKVSLATKGFKIKIEEVEADTKGLDYTLELSQEELAEINRNEEASLRLVGKAVETLLTMAPATITDIGKAFNGVINDRNLQDLEYSRLKSIQDHELSKLGKE